MPPPFPPPSAGTSVDPALPDDTLTFPEKKETFCLTLFVTNPQPAAHMGRPEYSQLVQASNDDLLALFNAC
jgi:hypothetical protein